MSVLVLSVIMVSLAPVVTKRVNDNISINNFKTEGVLFLVDETDPTRCNITSDVEGADPDTCSFQIPDDVTQISAVVVGNGGNGSNAVAGGTARHVVQEIKTSQNLTITKSMVDPEDGVEKLVKNLKIDYMVSGGAGGGAGWGEITSISEGEEPQSQQDCNEFVGQDRNVSNSAALTLFIPASMNGAGAKNLCVTKYNMGDNGLPLNTITEGVTIRTDCTDEDYSNYCCWQGTTSNSCTATGTWGSYSSNYSGCNRTVCTWYSADESCRAWAPTEETKEKWRLPTKYEIAGWKTQIATEKSTKVGVISLYLGDNGLQLCNYEYSNYGAVKCAMIYGGCFGSLTDECRPDVFWTSTSDASNTKYVYGLSRNGIYNYASGQFTKALSPRCVYGPEPNKVNSGAGGGSGASYTNHVIQNGLLEEDITLEIAIGAGGNGGTSLSNGSNGGNTSVKYGTKTVVAYGNPNNMSSRVAYGGNGTSTKYGGRSSSYVVRSHDGTSIKNGTTNSSKLGTNGATDALGETQTAAGGNGGHSDYQWGINGATGTQTWSGGGSGGTISSVDGMDGQYPGAGGGGGTATVDEHGNLTIGEGGKGADGVVIISYDLVPMTAPGSGGAGGGMVIGRNISVTSDDIVTVSFNPTILDIGENFTIEAISGGSAIGATAGVADDDAGSVTGDRSGSFQYQKGSDGTQGGEIPNTSFMFGGIGGASGTGIQGGCGGMNTHTYDDGTVFTNSATCLLNIPTNIPSYGSDGTFNVVEKNIVANSFGSAGSGGGGGGFSTDVLGNPIQGQGGKGANGYVYIWWIKNE